MKSCASSAASVSSAGNGQPSPATASRFNVSRTVDGATPTRRAISLLPTPAVFNRSTSRTWRIAILSAGIVPSRGKAKGADAKRASRDAAYLGDIIPEWRAKSSRNAERDQIGTGGDFIPDSRATSPGIRTSNGHGDLSPGKYSLGSCFVDEAVMTFFFLFVIIGTTSKGAAAGFAGIPIGLALTLIHLVSIPVTNTSVNPAHSTGPALFAGGQYIGQLWLFG